MSRRHVSKIKRAETNDIGIVLLAYETGQKPKSHISRYLLSTDNGESVIERQSKIISEVFSENSLYIATGSDCDKIASVMPKNVRIVENQNFQSTGAAEYIRLVINNSTERSLLIIDGNILFSEDVLLDLDFSKSFVLCLEGINEQQDIGATISEGRISQFSFGLKSKICDMIFLKDHELNLAEKICKNRDKNKLLIFEVLNFVVNNGGSIHPHTPKRSSSIKKIESAKDVYENSNI
jgi:hypothetical protein|tara:strand:- start:1548 stop:2258 length:711 start_codon:yes stop_codon:yes gene_type:complete